MASREGGTSSASSEALVESRPRRSTRKRRLSSISEATESSVDPNVQDSSSIASPTARKRQRQDRSLAGSKRGNNSAEVVVHHEHDDNEEGDAGDYDAEKPKIVDIQDCGVDKQVHFACSDVEEEEDELGHPEPRSLKMPIKRRKTTSPHGNTQLLKVMSARASLPSATFAAEGCVDSVMEPLRFTPLREMIDDRKRQKRGRLTYLSDTDDESKGPLAHARTYWIDMAKKEERIRTLIFELATGQYDERTSQCMGEELQALQDSIAEITAQKRSEEMLDSMLIVDNRITKDAALTRPTPSPFECNEEPDEDSVVQTALSMHWDAERTRLQDGVLALSQEVNDVRERWHIHEITLQSLGFGSEGASGDEVIAEIRRSFDDLRASVSSVLPTSIILHESNAYLLQVVAGTLEQLGTDSATLRTQVDDRNRLCSELRSQINNLVERIADAENELARLRKQRTELLRYGDGNDQIIADLERQISVLARKNSGAEDELTTTIQHLAEAEAQIDQLQQGAKRLKDSLRHYRNEEERLQTLITRMETDHRADVEKMNREREATVRDMDDQIDAELSARTAVGIQLHHEQQEVARLSKEISIVGKERDSVLEKLQKVDAELQTEHFRREQAEATTQMRSTEIDELGSRVDRLESQLAEVGQTATNLRELNEQERERRVLAENQLELLNSAVQETERRRDEFGVETNKLRLRLHELQEAYDTQTQRRDRLEEEAKQQYTDSLAAELTGREAAEQDSEAKAAAITILKSRLDELNQEAIDMRADHDRAQKTTKHQLQTQTIEIANLSHQLGQEQNHHRNTKRLNADKQSELEDSLRTLRDTLASHEKRIVNLQKADHDTKSQYISELADRDGEIEILKSTMASYEAQITDLETAKASLERRVEGEAEQMLHTQADKQDELDELRAALVDKQNKFLTVEAKARETDQRWQDLLNDREQELEHARTGYERQRESSASLSLQLQQQKARFAAYVHKSQHMMRRVLSATSVAGQTIREECDSLGTNGRLEFESLGQHDDTTAVLNTKPAREGRTRVTGRSSGKVRRRNHDSGIGIASDELEPDPIAA